MIFPGLSHSWEDLKFLQKHWDGPIILKGIQTVEDAQKCVDFGVRILMVHMSLRAYLFANNETVSDPSNNCQQSRWKTSRWKCQFLRHATAHREYGRRQD